MPSSEYHFITAKPLMPPFRAGLERVLLGMGCFWGAERLFWQLPGVEVTAVGYAGGSSSHPSYEEVCSGQTGHAEVVLVVYDPQVISFDRVLKHFWENHNPTQGMRQANDCGTQYRSAIYVTTSEQELTAQTSLVAYQAALRQSGLADITTEIKTAQPFFYAESYHQQYLAKNPGGYCNLQSIQKTAYPSYPSA